MFVNASTSEYRKREPDEDGVRSVMVFDNVEQWKSLGLTLAEPPDSSERMTKVGLVEAATEDFEEIR